MGRLLVDIRSALQRRMGKGNSWRFASSGCRRIPLVQRRSTDYSAKAQEARANE
jgi:hypothetical protein